LQIRLDGANAGGDPSRVTERQGPATHLLIQSTDPVSLFNWCSLVHKIHRKHWPLLTEIQVIQAVCHCLSSLIHFSPRLQDRGTMPPESLRSRGSIMPFLPNKPLGAFRVLQLAGDRSDHPVKQSISRIYSCVYRHTTHSRCISSSHNPKSKHIPVSDLRR
jgi:hypothetical protein